MMGCGGRSSRIIFSGLTLRRYNSKNVSRSNPTQEFLSSCTFSWRQEHPFVDGAKRFHNWGSVDNQLKANERWKRWMWNLETLVALAFFSAVVGTVVDVGSWETVPYTRRRQLLLPEKYLEEEAGPDPDGYEKMKKDYAHIILPPPHPLDVRARTIKRNLLEAFQRQEGDDDAGIKKTWDVVVFNDPTRHDVASTPSGKIFIYRGILDFLGDDAEIAAFIAPEIGRVVARHEEERITMTGLLTFVFLLIQLVLVSFVPSLSKYFKFRFPFARSLLHFIAWIGLPNLISMIYSLKMDVEADYIGLMLLASAGYDPRVALQAREKMLRMNGGGSWWEKMRARLLVLDMEEALSIYGEVMPEHDV